MNFKKLFEMGRTPPEVYTPWLAWLHLEGWSGRSKSPVIVVGETSTKYRIRTEKACVIAGRNRMLSVGETVLVPKRAISKRKRV